MGEPPPSYSDNYTPDLNERSQLIPLHPRQKTVGSSGQYPRTRDVGISLVAVLSLLSLVTTPLLIIVLARGPKSLPPDNAICQLFIHDWETRVQNLRIEEVSLKRRLNDLDVEIHQKIENFERELRERVERERRERERARLYWGELYGNVHCASSGYRMYHAQLLNLGFLTSIDKIDACKNTPAVINGIEYATPTVCEDRGFMQGVWGGWLAKDEVSCTAYWEFVKDKGCTAPHSGLRRYETKLGVVSEGENPELLCSTTPLSVNGQKFEHPHSCPDWGKYGFWGIWDVPDSECW